MDFPISMLTAFARFILADYARVPASCRGEFAHSSPPFRESLLAGIQRMNAPQLMQCKDACPGFLPAPVFPRFPPHFEQADLRAMG
jgi:hypothetical protein